MREISHKKMNRKTVNTMAEAGISPLEILATLNAHPRDKNIVFEPIEHKYTIEGASDYVSVTTYNSSHFEAFDPDDAIGKMRNGRNWGPSNKYYTMTDDEIKKMWVDGGTDAATLGENMHASIELFMNNSRGEYPYTHADLLLDYVTQYPTIAPDSVEWNYFLNYLSDNPGLVPYRTEWRIYDEDLKLAGSIDMVYKLADGTYGIYDWKRSKDMVLTPIWKKYATTECISHLYDTNYWHYVLQLNTYRRILQRKYGLRVTQLVLVRIHPNAGNYELYTLPMIDDEMNALSELRLEQVAYDKLNRNPTKNDGIIAKPL